MDDNPNYSVRNNEDTVNRVRKLINAIKRIFVNGMDLVIDPIN